jgi:putative phosphoesterase
MLVGVLSDIHDNLPNLAAAALAFRDRGIESLLFLGDFCSPIPARELAAYPGTVHCVFGNGDGDRFAIRGIAAGEGSALSLHGEWAELELGGRRVALTHYPLYARALARTGDYDAVFSGHTHERHEERFGGTLWVNPGEVLGWKGAPSVAVWDASANSVEFLALSGAARSHT